MDRHAATDVVTFVAATTGPALMHHRHLAGGNMQPAEVIAKLEGLAAAFNAHDIERIMSFFADDCRLDMPRGPDPHGQRFEGKERVREALLGRLKGIPDVHYGEV